MRQARAQTGLSRASLTAAAFNDSGISLDLDPVVLGGISVEVADALTLVLSIARELAKERSVDLLKARLKFDLSDDGVGPPQPVLSFWIRAPMHEAMDFVDEIASRALVRSARLSDVAKHFLMDELRLLAQWL